jgi:hypothetical protein
MRPAGNRGQEEGTEDRSKEKQQNGAGDPRDEENQKKRRCKKDDKSRPASELFRIWRLMKHCA